MDLRWLLRRITIGVNRGKGRTTNAGKRRQRGRTIIATMSKRVFEGRTVRLHDLYCITYYLFGDRGITRVYYGAYGDFQDGVTTNASKGIVCSGQRLDDLYCNYGVLMVTFLDQFIMMQSSCRRTICATNFRFLGRVGDTNDAINTYANGGLNATISADGSNLRRFGFFVRIRNYDFANETFCCRTIATIDRRPIDGVYANYVVGTTVDIRQHGRYHWWSTGVQFFRYGSASWGW